MSPVKSLCRDCLQPGDSARSRCDACGSVRVVNHEELGTLCIAHLDCDAFYASVEKRDRPELRDQPVIVGGGVRGVVSTACYIARQHGVRSAMPMFKARKLCPDAVVIAPDFRRYKQASDQILGRLAALTPLIQTLSLDEAWADLSGTERLNGGPPALQLVRLQAEIEREVGVTVSIGLAPNRFLAKIASDLDKPRGFQVIGAAEAVGFLAPRPVSILPGVGTVMARQLHSDGYPSIGDLAAADLKTLVTAYGEWGLRLHELAHARDARRVNPERDRKGMSAETTFNEDLSDIEALRAELWPLCEKLAMRARREGVAGQVAILKLRTSDFRLLTRRVTLPEPIQTARSLFAHARALLDAEPAARRYRLIGIGLANLVDAEAVPASLFDQGEGRALRTERAIDSLRGRFGLDAVQAGRALKPRPRPARKQD
ncbi:MAG: DNA polymerase IV [Brevundimonas sp.]|uniref:DNA polymerase IV n=1 Tax=Brevundimonas sp. TaxID=1871086 RepID=UPI00391A4006